MNPSLTHMCITGLPAFIAIDEVTINFTVADISALNVISRPRDTRLATAWDLHDPLAQTRPPRAGPHHHKGPTPPLLVSILIKFFAVALKEFVPENPRELPHTHNLACFPQSIPYSCTTPHPLPHSPPDETFPLPLRLLLHPHPPSLPL